MILKEHALVLENAEKRMIDGKEKEESKEENEDRDE